MVEAFYGLRTRPFPATAMLESYVQTSGSQDAIFASLRCIERGDGPAILVGGAGLGKTMNLLRIADEVRGQMQVAMIAGSQICTRRALLQTIVYHLGIHRTAPPKLETDEGRLRLSILQHLQSISGAPKPSLSTYPRPVRFSSEKSPRNDSYTGNANHWVLLFDEAQTLSAKLLDEIRILTNIVDAEGACLRVVLAGTPKLEETLTHPHLESLNQRIVSRAYLQPLGLAEVKAYLEAKVAIAGGRFETIFETGSAELIHRASEGVPRLIDQLADQSMYWGAMAGERVISPERISQAWSKLHLLPSPWTLGRNGESGPQDTANDASIAARSNAAAMGMDEANEEVNAVEFGSVEFGSLDDPQDTATCELVSSSDFHKDSSNTVVGDSSDRETLKVDGIDGTDGIDGVSGVGESGLVISEPTETLVDYFAPFLKNQLSDESASIDGPSLAYSLDPLERQVDSGRFDSAFREMIRSIHLEAVRTETHFRVRDNRPEGHDSQRVVSDEDSSQSDSKMSWTSESVDGDDRDLLVVVEEDSWSSPFAIGER